MWRKRSPKQLMSSESFAHRNCNPFEVLRTPLLHPLAYARDLAVEIPRELGRGAEARAKESVIV